MNDDRYSRNEALFGAEGQRKIAACRVAIIGLGGLGSHVAQQLAYLGVLDYLLLDGDVVTYSSLNRVVGAIHVDAELETSKVLVAERMIRQLQPDASLRTEPSWLAAGLDFAGMDFVFGCVDNDLARLQLTETASQFGIPYLDLASDTGGDGSSVWYGGRLVFAYGSGCLSCRSLLDQEEIRRARLSPEERQIDARLYGVDCDALEASGPAVVSVNGVVASLAVTEFIAWCTGLRVPAAHITYRGDRPSVGISRDQPLPSCFYCQRWSEAGVADEAA